MAGDWRDVIGIYRLKRPPEDIIRDLRDGWPSVSAICVMVGRACLRRATVERASGGEAAMRESIECAGKPE